MSKKCDKCQETNANVSYTETINGETRKMHLCSECADHIVGRKEEFLNSFFDLDPFRKVDQMFDSMVMPKSLPKKPQQASPGRTPERRTPPPQPQINKKEEILRELKDKVEALKQEEGIAVMLQDYMKAAELKNKREKLQKEAEQIINN